LKILVVTNLYPPHFRGGYEIRCKQVAEALQRAGHSVHVLTSTVGLGPDSILGSDRPPEIVAGVTVYRWLNQFAFPPQPVGRPWTRVQVARELSDARRFLRLLGAIEPDLVNWWSMYGLSKALLPIAPQLGIPDVHWIEHWWMMDEYGPNGEMAATFWTDYWTGRWGPAVARPLLRLTGAAHERRVRRERIPTREFPNRPRHVCFVSEFLRDMHRDGGFQFVSEEVIHGGVPVEQFYLKRELPTRDDQPLRLLYVGQLTPDRGLHTILEALSLLPEEQRDRVALTVVGTGQIGYLDMVRSRAARPDLSGRVAFHGLLPHAELPSVYRAHDLLLFASTRAEGLPLTMIEAMLAGCAVLTTGSGGAAEIAKAAGLSLVRKDDAASLSGALAALIEDRAELHRIATRGQEAATTQFAFDGMIDRFVATLDRLTRVPGQRDAGALRSIRPAGSRTHALPAE
jgi:glycogen synthase